MRFGAHLPQIDFDGTGHDVAVLGPYVEAARDLGYSAITANDHLVFQRPCAGRLGGVGQRARPCRRPHGRDYRRSARGAGTRGPGPDGCRVEPALRRPPRPRCRTRLVGEGLRSGRGPVRGEVVPVRRHPSPSSAPSWRVSPSRCGSELGVGGRSAPGGRVWETGGWRRRTTRPRSASPPDVRGLDAALQSAGREPLGLPARPRHDVDLRHRRPRRSGDQARPSSRQCSTATRPCSPSRSSSAARTTARRSSARTRTSGVETVLIWPVGDPVGQLHKFAEQVFPRVPSTA